MYPFFGGAGLYGAYRNCHTYGSLELTEASPPQSFNEPLDIEDVGGFLNLPDSMVQAQGAQLLMFISAAREQAEILQGRDLVLKQWDLVFDFFHSYRIELRPRLASVDLMQYRDSTGTITPMVANTDFIVDTSRQPGVVTPPYNGQWPSFTPWPSGAVLVRFTAGVAPDSIFWSDAGARVKVGMKLLISEWFSNRIPFGTKVEEFPYGITSCLSFGAVPRVK